MKRIGIYIEYFLCYGFLFIAHFPYKRVVVMLKIYIFSGYGHNQSYELVGNSVFIGRSEENDIQISDMSVSRRHLKIKERLKEEPKNE